MFGKLGMALAALAAAGLAACDAASPVADDSDVAALNDVVEVAVAVSRPFGGYCALTVLPRSHDDGGGCGGDEGGCGGAEGGCEGEEPGGGPPIPRHNNLEGVCVFSLLGATPVTGRLNLTGPFASGEPEVGAGMLGARGRLELTAANGDVLVGSYVPVEAAFTAKNGDGGNLAFTSTFRVNQACEGGGHEGGMGGGEEGHEEPVSTGRFAAATGGATMQGKFRIFASTQSGTGTIRFVAGTLAY